MNKEDEPNIPERPPSPKLARISPLPPRSKGHRHEGKIPNKSSEPNVKTSCSFEKPDMPAAVEVDDEGNRIWICPGCGRQDDGSPMVGCDGCDAWFHWVCVGILVAPESKEWFCKGCDNKKTHHMTDKKKKNRKKKLLQ